jgi:hypothetical protein
MTIYIVAFIVAMVLTIFVFQDSLFEGRKKTDDNLKLNGLDSVGNVDKKYENLERFMNRCLEMLGESRIFDNKIQNRSYYEEGNYSLTLFEYEDYSVICFFQLKPYKQIAECRIKKSMFSEYEVNYKETPKIYHNLINVFFSKIFLLKNNITSINTLRGETETIYSTPMIDNAEKDYRVLGKRYG